MWNGLMRSKNMIIKKWPKEGKSTRMERVREGETGRYTEGRVIGGMHEEGPSHADI